MFWVNRASLGVDASTTVEPFNFAFQKQGRHAEMKNNKSKGILGFLQTKRKERLFQQWVNQAGLPVEEVPQGLLDEQSNGEDLHRDDGARENVTGHTTSISIDRGTVRLPFRYLLVGVSIILLSLVALSVVCTILIMRP